jgi:methylmalonyl-CoA mutase cobalamin-binding subunit
MRIRVDDSDLLPELLVFLNSRVDLVTARATETEAEVSVLGSFADGGRAELDSHLEHWREAHPSTTVVIVGGVARLRPRAASA